MTSMDIVKAGDMFRKSKILRRWKKAWFVLYSTGELKYFENMNKLEPCETIVVPVECRMIQIGNACDVDPPSEHSKACQLTLCTHEEDIHLCAESEDDCLAWAYMLDQARLTRPPPTYYPNSPGQPSRPSSCPPPYHQQVFMSGQHGTPMVAQRVIQHPDGSQTVYVGEQPYHYCRHCHHGSGYCSHCDGGLGVAGGLGLGMAAGALMWTPFLWGPFMWC